MAQSLTAILTTARAAGANEALERQLEAIVAAARRAWPLVALDADGYVAYLAERLPKDSDAAQALAQVHSIDLYLACACARGMAPAIATFESEYLRHAGIWIARIDHSPDFIDDVRQRARERLLVGARPRICDYVGSGPLGAWVRVAVTRVALNARRETERREPLYAVPDSAPDPELEAICAQYRVEVEAALKAALARLDGDQRALLRLHYIQALNFQEIGRLLSLDRSNVSRRVAAARRFLLAATKAELARLAPAMTPASRDSLLLALRSRINISLSTAL